MSGYSVARKGWLLAGYMVGMMSVTLAIGMLASILAQQLIASADPTWGKGTGPPSRVETALEIRAKARFWQPDDHVEARSGIFEPALTASALAAGIDSAERAGDVRPVTIAGLNKYASVSQGPSVAGWKRRVAFRHAASKVSVDAESTARIIERSLRAEVP